MYRDRHPLEGPLIALLLFNQIFAMIGFYAAIRYVEGLGDEPTRAAVSALIVEVT